MKNDNFIIKNKIDFIPKVSIIIPVYNVEDYLAECLDSVLGQSLKEIEVVCVNDGSVDGSLNILKEYAEKDYRITLISRENKGVGYSRNEGIEASCGEFIAFMDPDDYYSDDEILEKMYNGAIDNNVDIAGGSLIVYDESQKKEIAKTDYYNKFKENSLINYSDYQYDYGFQKFIYSASLIKENSIEFPNYRRFQDPPFMVKAMAKAGKFYALEMPTYTYRWSHKSVEWTEEKIYNLLLGLRDDISLAFNYKFDKLYDIVLTRIKKEYKAILLKENSVRINEVKGEIMEICLQKAKNDYSDKQNIIPKVSVILPIYNASEYLRECLDSVVSQTLKEIEIICVNDGSIDNSLDIIKEYAEKDERIKYIDKPNAGYGQTMNCGLELASGEYIGIVEPDDFIKPEMYETLYNKAQELNLDVIKADYYQFEKVNDKYEYKYCKVFNVAGDFYNRVLTPEIDDKILYIFSINPAGIFKKEFLEKFEIKHNESPGASYQDNGFYVQTMYLADRIFFMDKPFYCYRQDNPNQSMKKKNNTYVIPEEYHFIDKVFEKFEKLSKLKKVYFYRKFASYLFHMEARLDLELWNEYLTYIAKEFKEHIDNDDVDKKYFSPYNLDRLNTIVNNPCAYIQKFCPDKAQNIAEMTSKISVIIPVYNVEKYLPQCLDSILNQTYKNIEIICIDDCSTDNSYSILEDYAKKDSRLQVLKNSKNSKQGAARNKGLAVAKGKFIMFVDADDYLNAPNVIELFLKAMVENNVDVVVSHIKNFADDKNLETIRDSMDNYYKTVNRKAGKITVDSIMGFRVGPVAKLFKKEIIDRYKIVFPENLIQEDDAFHWAYFSIIKSAYCIQDPLYNRRIHSAGTMVQRETNNVRLFDIISITNIIIDTLKRNKVFKKYKNQLFAYYKNNANHVLNRCTDKKLYKQAKKKLLKVENKIMFAPMQKIFSIKNTQDGKHKVLTVLGIKIKFKRKKKGENKFFENIFSVKNKGAHKVITIFGAKMKFKNKELVQRNRLFELEAKIDKALNVQLKEFQQFVATEKKAVEMVASVSGNIKNEVAKLNSENQNLKKVIEEQKKEISKLQTELGYINEWQQNFYKSAPQKYPVRLSDPEKEAIARYTSASEMYLEFGSGGSTFIALNSPKTTIYSVESDNAWIDYLKSYNLVSGAIEAEKLEIRHIDIGKTKEWGYPINDDKKENYPNYSAEIFERIEKDKIDLVFVDGRFRVACVLSSIINCKNTTKIMIHDYTFREFYHVIEEFLDCVEIADTLAIFSIKENVDKDKVKEMYEKYKYVLE